MPEVGIPVTVRRPDFPGGLASQPTWETVIAPDDSVPYSFNAAQQATSLLVPPNGRRITLFGVMMSTDTAGNISIGRSSGGYLVPPAYIAANGGCDLLFLNGLLLGVGETLTITSSIAGNHSVMLNYKIV